MSNPPERIWIEDEFGEGDDDQWTYGTWDVRNYRGYVVEYVRADIVQALTADRDRLREASGDVIRETFASYRQAEEAYAAHLKAEADNARLRSLVGKAYDEGYTDGFSTPVKNPRGDFKCSMAFAALTGKEPNQ
jgi:hypothetical protein